MSNDFSPFEPAPRAFISYARSDGESFATDLRLRLESEHPEITLWQDRTRMQGGIGWWKQITDALDKVNFLIMVITPAAIESKIARQEWRYARQQGVRICPVMATSAASLPIDALPSWMKKAHFYDIDREWATFVGFLASAARGDRVPFMAPDLPGSHVMRQAEVDALLDRFHDAINVDPLPANAALQGAGGFGKTTIAAAVCHDDRIITAFDDGVLWVSLGETPDIQGQLTKLFAALTGQRPAFVDVDEAAIHLADRLERKHCLLVIDDVWDTNHLKPFLRGGDGCARLITTRFANVAVDAGAEPLMVNQMSPDESADLLGSQIDTVDAARERVRDLAERLGQWPLLLKLAAGQLKSRLARGDTLDGALTYLNRAVDKRGPIAFDKSNPTSRHDAITSTLQISLKRFGADERERCAALALFPRDHLIPLGAAESLWDLDAFDTEDLAQRLDDAALIEFDLKYGGIRIHNVLQSFLASQVTDIAALHRRLTGRWLSSGRSSRNAYAWTWIGWHLVRGGDEERLKSLMFDFDLLLERLRMVDMQVVLKDLDVLESSPETTMLRSALQLASHGLKFDADQLCAQLNGRLPRGKTPLVDGLLDEANAVPGRDRLILADTSLTHPGGALTAILKSHTGSVENLALSPDGRYVATASKDRTVRIWDLATGRVIRTLAGHDETVHAVVWTPDMRHLLTGSEDRTLRVWSVDDAALQAVLRGHTLAVTGLAVAADGYTVVSVSEDGSARVWNLSIGESRQIFKGPHHQLRPVVIAPGHRAIFGAGDWSILVVDMSTGAIVRTLEGHDGIVTSLALSADGATLLSGAQDETMRQWHLQTGACTRVFEGHTGSVDAVMLLDKDRIAVSGSKDRTLRVWDLESGAARQVLEGHSGFVRSLAPCGLPDQILSGAGDKTIRRWNLKGQQASRPRKSHGGPVSLLAVATDGSRVVSGTRRGDLILWRLDPYEAPRDQGTIEAHTDWVSVLQMVPDGARAITGSYDNTLCIWDLAQQCMQRVLTGHAKAVRGMEVSPDGARVISLSRDGTMRAWNLDNGRCTRVLVCDNNHRTLDTLQRSSALLEEIEPGPAVDLARRPVSYRSSFALDSDGSRVIYGSHGCAGVWNADTGAVHEQDLGDIEIVGIALRGDGAVFATWGGQLVNWTAHTDPLFIAGHDSRIIDLVLTADGHRAFTAGHDDTIRCWDLATGAQISRIAGPFGAVDTVAIAPDGRHAYSVYGDTLVAYALDEGRRISSLSFDHQITALSVTPDGHRVIVGDQSGGVHFLNLGR